VNGGLLLCLTCVHAPTNGTVVGISSVGQFDIAVTDAAVVGGVETQPVVAVENLYPGMSFPLAHKESVDVAGGDALPSAEGYHEVGKVLAYALTRLHNLCRRGLYRGGLWLILDVLIEPLADIVGGLNGIGADIGNAFAKGSKRRGLTIEKQVLAAVLDQIGVGSHDACADVGKYGVGLGGPAEEDAVVESIAASL